MAERHLGSPEILYLAGAGLVAHVSGIEARLARARAAGAPTQCEPTERRALTAAGIETLIVSGTETDVCMAGAVLHAVDLGLRVVVVEDGVCSSSDLTHRALMTAYHTRLRWQVQVASAQHIAALWTPRQVAHA